MTRPEPPGPDDSIDAVTLFAEAIYVNSGMAAVMRRQALRHRRLPPTSDPKRRQQRIKEITDRVDQLFIGLLTNALRNNPLHRKGVRRALSHGDLTPKRRREPGFDKPKTSREQLNYDKKIDRQWSEVCEDLDPASAESAEEAIERLEALITLCGDLLALTFKLLPRWMRRAYRGDLTIDGTPIGLWGKPRSVSKVKVPTKRSAKATTEGELIKRQMERVINARTNDDVTEIADAVASEGMKSVRYDAANPFAGYYVREDKVKWAYEAHLLVTTDAELAAHDRGLPSLVLGVGLATPGVGIADMAVMLLRDHARLGLPTRYLAADTPYGHTDANVFARPVHELGYQPLIPLHPNVIGRQGPWGPAAIVDGDLYSPSLPDELAEATARHQKRIEDIRRKHPTEDADRSRLLADAEDDYQRNLREREKYRLVIEQWDAEGILPYRVACGANATAQRLVCNNSTKSVTRGRKREARRNKQRTGRPVNPMLQIITDVPQNVLCTQSKVSLSPTDPGADTWLRNNRPFTPGSAEGKKRYNQARNTSEGINGFAKDKAFEALDSNQVRRAHGLAANMILATFQLLAANLRKIRSFLKEEAERQRLADGGARSKAYNPDVRRPAFGPHGSTGEMATKPGLPAWFRPFAVDTS